MLSRRISTVAAPHAVFVEQARRGPDELNNNSAQTMGCTRNLDPKAKSRPAPVENGAVRLEQSLGRSCRLLTLLLAVQRLVLFVALQ